MSGEKIVNLRSVVVPLLSLVGGGAVLASMIWWAASTSTTVSIHDQQIKSLETKVETLPNKTQYEDIKASVDQLHQDMLKVMSLLATKK